MKADEFDKQFDDGDDILNALDLSKAKRVMQDQKRVNVDFPAWMIESLDREAGRVGVTRQSIIKVWLAERLEESAANKALRWMIYPKIRSSPQKARKKSIYNIAKSLILWERVFQMSFYQLRLL